MANVEHAPGYVPNPDYTQEDWDEVCDNPELTKEDFANMRPVEEMLPELAAALRKQGEAHTGDTAPFSLRIDRDILDAYRATGPGWQDRMSEVLRKAVGL